MAQWTEGHKLLAKFQPFSREAHRAFVDASIAAFSKERLQDGPRAQNRDPAPVFVVGMPRSGTTLVEQILAAHRDVFGAGERVALGRAFARSAAETRRRPQATSRRWDAAQLDRAAETYLAELHALAPDKAASSTRCRATFSISASSRSCCPAAKIIHCRRDPRDIGLSIFTFRFHGAHGYAHDLADLGWYIGEHDRLMAHWRAALPNAIVEVKLSDWVDGFRRDAGARARTISICRPTTAARASTSSDSRVRTVSRAQVRQPINARGLGRWRAFAPALAPLIAELDKAGSLASWA